MHLARMRCARDVPIADVSFALHYCWSGCGSTVTTISSLQAIGKSAVRKAGLIVLPTVLVTGLFAYIDRTNLAYAAVSVKKAININNSQYGLASGILYLSYCFFQVRFRHRPWTKSSSSVVVVFGSTGS